MTVEITFDMTQFKKALSKSPDAVAKGIKTGLRDIKNDWQAEAIDVAPMKDGTLRQQIDANVKDLSVEITANAVRDGFNYAYYIHEDKGKAVTGEKKFLDVPAEQNEAKWAKWLEDEIEGALKRAGWH